MPIFKLVEEALIDVVQQGSSDTLLVQNAHKLAEPDRSMDALSKQVVWNDALTEQLAQFLKHHMDRLNDQRRLESILEHQVRPNQTVHAKNKNEIPTSPMHLQSLLNWGSKRNSDRKHCSVHHSKGKSQSGIWLTSQVSQRTQIAQEI